MKMVELHTKWDAHPSTAKEIKFDQHTCWFSWKGKGSGSYSLINSHMGGTMVFDQQQQIMPTDVGFFQNWATKSMSASSVPGTTSCMGQNCQNRFSPYLGINSPGRDGSRTAGTAGRVYPVALRNRIITSFDFLRETKPLISTVNPMFKIFISCIIILYV